MRELVIKKGKHRPSNRQWWYYPLNPLFSNRKYISASYIFGESCRYTLDKGDQADWNKLMGLSFSLSPLDNAVMVGWRYSKEFDMIELAIYVNSKEYGRYYKEFACVKIGEVVNVSIQNKGNNILYKAYTQNRVHKMSYPHTSVWRKYCYALGLYFGGNRTAPHDIKVIRVDAPYI